MSNAPEEDDRTILSPSDDSASPTAADTPTADDDDGHALPAGTLIGEFELRAKIGEGGFSIVYLAWDHSLERKVALKEYMPGSLASRRGTTTVAPRSERHRATYDAGLRSFVNEAKLLAHFDHPSLVKVYRFWEANGTAYMVMPLYEGETLKERIQADRSQVNEAWLSGILAPLCDALRLIHGEQCYHRDIAPDNIILLKGSGRPLLLDFGAARRVIGDMTQALTVILKPGYAPVEQYAELPDMKQGPWTDVYALAATVHWVITGSTPPPAVGRLLNDQYVPLADLAPAGFSPAFLAALDRALTARPELRTQTITDFGQGLGLLPPPPSATPQNPAAPAAARPPAAPRLTPRAVAGGAALILAAAAAWWVINRAPAPAVPAGPALPTTPQPSSAAPQPSSPEPQPSSPEPQPSSPEPQPSSPAPQPSSPARQPSSPARQPSSPARQPSSPAPQPSSPAPQPSSLAPQPSTPAEHTSSAEPSASSSGRESSMPGQESPKPEAQPPTPGPAASRPGTRASSPESKPPKPAPPSPRPKETSVRHDKANTDAPPRSAECARILQRISLGESSPELMARLEQARCR